MRKFKRLAAMLLALIMVWGMTTTAYAVNITLSKTDSVYSAYRLLTAEKLTDGSGKYNYTVVEKYAGILADITGETESGEILKYIEAMETDSAELKAFAAAVYKAIDEADLDADEVSEAGVIENADQGYYLIAETTLSDAADTYSLIMLRTAGEEDITVSTKEGKPEVVKSVKEVNDSTGETSWGKYADHDLYDEIEYQIKGTVSSEYADYKSYYYSFVDEMSDSLTLNGESVTVWVGGTVDEDGTYNKNGVEVTEQFEITTQDHKLVATANLKELTGVEIDGTSEIYVLYTATLNENAVHGKEGNENEVYLKYENNPYHEADGDNDPKTPNEPETPGETPKDINIVFTFKTLVNKVDAENAALEGAGFTLYKWNGSVWEEVEEVVGTEEDSITEFEFKGLDCGKYKLSETTIPNGYNQAEDIIFEVEAEYEMDTATGKMKLVNLIAKDEQGAEISSTDGEDQQFLVDGNLSGFSTTVINKPGVTLPTTGGVGTTIFYIAGGVLVVAAVVLLITKKRMSGEK